jgi:putative sporulation protein YtaF
MQTLHLVTILLLSLSSNLDNIGVGVSYGVRKINITFTSNLLIALITSSGTFLSILLGQGIYLFISAEMAGLLGGSIIIAAGIWVIFQEKAMHRGKEPQEEKQLVAETGLSRFGFRQIVSILNNPVIADWDFSGHIDLKEATALALGLTINNIPNGVGAGMLGLSLILTTISVLFFSIITIWIGISSGHFGFHRLGKSTGVISGLILIFIGVCQIFF